MSRKPFRTAAPQHARLASFPSRAFQDDASPDRSARRPHAGRQARLAGYAAVLLAIAAAGLSGCAACHPIDGLPARYLPSELQAPSRAGRRTIDLSLLRQSPCSVYRLDAGDVLGIYIEGVLGRREEIAPVHFPENGVVPPAFGFPIPVRDDGTVSLPMIEPVNARGLSLREFEDALRDAYLVKKKILQPGRDRILVSLLKPRTYRVLVIRQEAGTDPASFTGGGQGQFNLGVVKRGTGCVVELPAYSNDVLNALAQTGGLPGLDAENAIYIIRNKAPHAAAPVPAPAVAPMPAPVEPAAPETDATVPTSQRIGANGILLASAETGWGHSEPAVEAIPTAVGGQPQAPVPPFVAAGAAPAAFAAQGNVLAAGGPIQPIPQNPLVPQPEPMLFDQHWLSSLGYDATIGSDRIVKIPIRLAEGEVPQFTEQDIILYDGDVVFIESRDTEIFYTGGLLGGGQYTLPRDYDLDVLGAVSIAESQNNQNGVGRSIGGVSALNQDVTVSASNVIILRTLPNGTQVPIKVDLYQAVRNPAERVLIQPGDYVILQYTPGEAVLAFIERHLIEGALFGIAGSNWGDND